MRVILNYRDIFWEFWLKLAGMRTNAILARILAEISRNKNKYNFGLNFG